MLEPREAPCVGGPLDGQNAISRFPKGFLLADRVTTRCWIYEWDDERDAFVVRDERPDVLYDHGPRNRFRAAEEFNYDVLAAPWIGGEAQ